MKHTPRIAAARRLVNSIKTTDDFQMYLLGHPREFTGMDKLLNDVQNHKPKKHSQGLKRRRAS